MLIIIEGCDGAGKTTLAERLVNRLEQHRPTTLLHRGPIKDDPLVEYELPLDGYRPLRDQHVVCDRWHVGEAIYGPLLRGVSVLRPPDRRHIELFLQSRGALVVLMTQTPEEIRRRLAQRGEALLGDEYVEDVLHSYYEACHRTILPVTYAYDATDEVVDKVLQAGFLFDEATAWMSEFPTYVGSPRPDYLLLGERRNELKSEGHSSAFVPYAGTSGRYLLESLPDHVADTMGIANALEEDVPALVERLDFPRVVTLGTLAHRRLLELEMNHGAVPHPQFVRRFHHAHRQAYGRALTTALVHQREMMSWRP